MDYLAKLIKISKSPASFKALYHGTYKSSAISSIFEKGLKGREFQDKSKMAPIANSVYLATEFNYAMIYALGGSYIGQNHIPSDFKKEPLGFIFKVDKDKIENLEPDEDLIGKILYNMFNNRMAQDYLLLRLANKLLTPRTILKIKEGEYAYFAQAGKKFIKNMSSFEKDHVLDVASKMEISDGVTVFAKGFVPVIGAWVFRRDQANLFTGDLEQDKQHMFFIKNAAEIEQAKKKLSL